MSVCLRILKAALLPFVPDQISALGHNALACLPPSSPVRKHGFEPDVRAALHMLSEHSSLFQTPPLAPHIRSLSRIRDRWAHQQDLTDEDVTRFARIGGELLENLRREPEARALRQLASAPDPELARELEWFRERSGMLVLSFEELQTELGLADDVEDAARLHRILIWDAAFAVVCGGPPLCLLTVLSGQDAHSPEEVGLPGSSFWWVLGHAYDAPVAIRRAAWKTWHAELAASARDA